MLHPVVSADEPNANEPGSSHHAERVHAGWRARFVEEIARREKLDVRLSAVRGVTFLATGTLAAIGFTDEAAWAWIGAVIGAAAFAVGVVAQQRVRVALENARVRRDLHERHLARISGRWLEQPGRKDDPLPRPHAYAWDVDVVGEGSLLQRIDVTQTVHGERALLQWLGQPATREQILERQAAVRELAEAVELRQELEASGLRAALGSKLDGTPFHELARLPSYFETHRYMVPLIFALPLITLVLYVLGQLAVLPSPLWVLPVIVQLGMLMSTGGAARRAFDLVASRQGAVEAFEHMLRVVERAPLQAPLLRSIQARLAVGGTPPSKHMGSLRTWASCAELRQQALLYIVVNPLTLWDLHVLRGIEAWVARVGTRTPDWFVALGELEALSALATLAYCDPAATMPEVSDEPGPLKAEGLVHPLITAEARVGNDLTLAGPGSALIVTGSNMAGKSTLLRALGLNVALALAGGPVCAKAMRVPRVRMRASMRAEDSLQRGASYFHAELQKLRMVIEDAEQAPPVLFLLDELLRGTNQRARHVGSRAVLMHLLKRSGLGLVATHDIALSALEQEYPGKIGNVHFTDVVVGGEMVFDYRLRPGVVKTSNALRLLIMAGIEVPEEEAIAEGPLASGEPVKAPREGKRI